MVDKSNLAPDLSEAVLTASETAGLLKLKVATVRRLLHDGTLPGVRVGKSWRVQGQALRGFLAIEESVRPVADSSPRDAQESKHVVEVYDVQGRPLKVLAIRETSRVLSPDSSPSNAPVARNVRTKFGGRRTRKKRVLKELRTEHDDLQIHEILPGDDYDFFLGPIDTDLTCFTIARSNISNGVMWDEKEEGGPPS